MAYLRSSVVSALILVLTLGIGVPEVRANGAIINDDLFVGVWSPFRTRWEAEVPVCVWNDENLLSYQIIANGTSSGNQFALSNDVDDQISYRVFWHTGDNFRRRERLSPDTPSRRSYLYSESSLCTAGPNARLRVRLNRRSVDSAPPGIYTDTLLITIAPL